MFFLIGVICFIVLMVIVYNNFSKRSQDDSGSEELKELNRKITELDIENVETSEEGIAKVIIPDSVNAEESTLKSTQKEECKEVIVEPKEKIEKIVVEGENDN